MAITQYLQNESAFDLDDIKVMSRALEDACKALNIDGDAGARQTIAFRIIELARQGERDQTKLRDQVVHEANGATAPVASVVVTMSSVVPLFRDSGFDAEGTRNLGKAYDIACRSLHPKGRPPVVQEILAKKIIEVAQRGERDPDQLAAIALGIMGPFHRDVSRRFGLVPNFFMSAPDAPEIVEKLWDFAKSAYLESRFPRSSRNACLSSCRGSARSATVLFATADFLWVTAIHRAIQRPSRKPSSRRSSFSRYRRRGDANSTRSIKD